MQQPIELILLRQWASYLAVPLVLLDAQGQLLFYNDAAEAILGHRFEDATQVGIETLLRTVQLRAADGRPLEPGDNPLAAALTSDLPVHRRVRLRALDGAWHLLDTTAVPVIAQGNRRLGVFAMFWEAPLP